MDKHIAKQRWLWCFTRTWVYDYQLSGAYVSWVCQLSAMGCNDLLQLEEESLPEPAKIPGHGWGGVQLQVHKSMP